MATGLATDQQQELKEILDVKGAAKLLRCSPAHLSNILNGKVKGLPPIPHVRAGRLRLIRRQKLMEWVEQRELASQDVAQR
jgi:excisionase family DNA binding protein